MCGACVCVFCFPLLEASIFPLNIQTCERNVPLAVIYLNCVRELEGKLNSVLYLISDVTSNKYITSNQIFAKCFFWLLMFCFLMYLDMSVLLMLSNLAATNSAFAYKIFLASLACKNQHSGRFLSLLCRFMQNAFC